MKASSQQSVRVGNGATEATRVGAVRVVLGLGASLRPRQWAKNLLVFGGLVFSASFLDPIAVWKAAGAFVAFCLLSSSVYLLNDVRDREKDLAHPEKRLRPIASGEVSVRLASGTALVLLVVSLWGAWVLNPYFAGVAIAYLLLQGSYIYGLKDVVLLDVFVVSTGFVLRALAGAAVLEVRFSPWLFLCTMMLALFLSFGKRRHELLALGSGAAGHRSVLSQYTPSLLDAAVMLSATCAVMSYALYTIQSTTGRENPYIMLTNPLVLYGILRYLYHLYSRQEGGSPERLLFQDSHMWVTVFLWIVSALGAMLLGRMGLTQ